MSSYLSHNSNNPQVFYKKYLGFLRYSKIIIVFRYSIKLLLLENETDVTQLIAFRHSSQWPTVPVG